MDCGRDEQYTSSLNGLPRGPVMCIVYREKAEVHHYNFRITNRSVKQPP